MNQCSEDFSLLQGVHVFSFVLFYVLKRVPHLLHLFMRMRRTFPLRSRFDLIFDWNIFSSTDVSAIFRLSRLDSDTFKEIIKNVMKTCDCLAVCLCFIVDICVSCFICFILICCDFVCLLPCKRCILQQLDFNLVAF